MSDLTQEFVDVFCEFVEAVIHQILHLRRIYRPDLFERHRLYGITTRKSRHPELNEYIHGIATSIKASSQAVMVISSHPILTSAVDCRAPCYKGYCIKLQ